MTTWIGANQSQVVEQTQVILEEYDNIGIIALAEQVYCIGVQRPLVGRQWNAVILFDLLG